MKDITYEQSKCVCCDKVYTNFFVISVSHEKDMKNVVCFHCANDIKNAVKALEAITVQK